jgi:hypothetical protein
LLTQAGLPNAVPCGVRLSDIERAFIERHKPSKAYITGDRPELIAFLQKLEVPCYRLAIDLPAKPDAVAMALKAAEPIEASMGPDAIVRVTEDDIKFDCGGRKYEVRELAPGERDRMRVRIRTQGDTLFHLGTLDLYAGRSRVSFARAVAPILAVSDKAIEGDLCLMIRKLEAIRTARKSQVSTAGGAYVMTPDEEEPEPARPCRKGSRCPWLRGRGGQQAAGLPHHRVPQAGEPVVRRHHQQGGGR